MAEKFASSKERLVHLLTGREGVTHRDLKLMRGPAAVVSEDELCDQVNSAIVRKRAGKLKPIELPRTGNKTNIKKFVEAL